MKQVQQNKCPTILVVIEIKFHSERIIMTRVLYYSINNNKFPASLIPQ